MDKMKVVETFSTRAEAELARGYLKAQGIRAVVQADDEGGAAPFLQLTLGVKVLVPKRDFKKAVELLKNRFLP